MIESEELAEKEKKLEKWEEWKAAKVKSVKSKSVKKSLAKQNALIAKSPYMQAPEIITSSKSVKGKAEKGRCTEKTRCRV